MCIFGNLTENCKFSVNLTYDVAVEADRISSYWVVEVEDDSSAAHLHAMLLVRNLIVIGGHGTAAAGVIQPRILSRQGLFEEPVFRGIGLARRLV